MQRTKAISKNMHAGRTTNPLPRLVALASPCRHRAAMRTWLLALCLMMGFFFPVSAQRQQPRRSGAADRVSPNKVEQEFSKVAAQAATAREAGRLDEAVGLYRRGVALRPRWDEGWWYLATLLYDRDNFAEATQAFRVATTLRPKAGPAWAMLGLCEFQLGQYDHALSHLRQGRALGIGDNKEMSRAMRFSESSILLLKGEFETAQQTLGTLSYDGVNNETLIIGHGLAVLRIPMLPKQVDVNHRERALIRRAGYAEHMNAQKNLPDAQREYERLAADFPKTPNVQYAYGRFLTASGDDEKAIAAFEREIQNSSNHAMARFQIAYIKLRNKDAAGGVQLAEEAVKLNPRLALGHYLFGRLLFDTNQIPRAISELETSARMTPNDARIYFALARAYARANRKADADRARQTFTRLNKLAEEETAQGANRAEAIPQDTSENAKPGAP